MAEELCRLCREREGEGKENNGVDRGLREGKTREREGKGGERKRKKGMKIGREQKHQRKEEE